MRKWQLKEYAKKNGMLDHAFYIIDEIGQYAAIEELDEVIVHHLIYKIVVSEKQVVDSEKIQRVRIVYNFVGEFVE